MIGTTTATTILVVPVNPPLLVLGALDASAPSKLFEADADAVTPDGVPVLAVGVAIEVDVRMIVDPSFEVVTTTVSRRGGAVVGLEVTVAGGAVVGVAAGGVVAGVSTGGLVGGVSAGGVVAGGGVVGVGDGAVVGSAGGALVAGTAVVGTAGDEAEVTGLVGTGKRISFSTAHFYGRVCRRPIKLGAVGGSHLRRVRKLLTGEIRYGGHCCCVTCARIERSSERSRR